MPTSSRRFLFLLASTRRQGNSEQLAHLAARHLPAAVEQHWLYLPDCPLPTFIDLRHDSEYPAPEGNAKLLLDATLHATDLVLVTPLYWYSLSGPAKQYFDYWSAWMRTPNVSFRERMAGKTLWAIVASSGSRAEVLPLQATLQLTADYMQLHWGSLLLGNGSRPGDVLQDQAAQQQAKTFFTGIAR